MASSYFSRFTKYYKNYYYFSGWKMPGELAPVTRKCERCEAYPMPMRLMLMLVQCIVLFLIPFFVQGQTAAPSTKPRPETEFKMQNGSYLGFGQVYLGMGEIGFKVEVSNQQKAESTLEFRIDKPKGKIIG